MKQLVNMEYGKYADMWPKLAVEVRLAKMDPPDQIFTFSLYFTPINRRHKPKNRAYFASNLTLGTKFFRKYTQA